MAKESKKQSSEEIIEEEVKTEQEETAKKNSNGKGKSKSKKESKTDALQAELDEYKDKYLRLYSEFENFRRRTNKEKLSTVQTANERLIVDLLPVIDDFERAEKSFDEDTDVKAIKEGVDLIYNKLNKVLEVKGAQKFVSKGETFDPEIHEAVTQIPAPEDGLKGKVVDVIEEGYKLNDKVIRFAKVVIGA